LTARAYPIALYVGIVGGLEASLLAARASGLSTARVLAALGVLTALALLGARLLYVLPRWRVYAADPARIVRFREGGAAMFGGLLLAVPASLALVPALGLPLARFWDVATFTMLPALIITRVGCTVAGCCAGRETCGWLGMTLRNARGVRARRLPVQLMDAACGVLLLAVAAGLWRSRAPDGAVVLVVVAGYGAARIGMDGLREQRDRLGGVVITPVIGMVLSVVSLVLLARLVH